MDRYFHFKNQKKMLKKGEKSEEKENITVQMMSIGDPSYWEERYQHELKKMLNFKLFDWYAPFDTLYPMVENVLDRTIVHKVLVVGVGRSNVIESLYGKRFCAFVLLLAF